MDKVVSLCKRRGFIFQSSEIYGGLSNTWDYGPYGVELKNNLKRAWWKANVYERDDIYGMDAAILMHPKVWEASGHIDNFFDVMLDCNKCKKRFRIDQVQQKYPDKVVMETVTIEGKTCVQSQVIGTLKCFECDGELGMARKFNLMFKTFQGPVEDRANLLFMRPETAQGMFVNFSNVLDSRHPKLPFGLAQIGKAFRNEITPGNFTFRTREFEQMEIEYFVRPEDADKKLEEWVEARFGWYLNLGMTKENLRKRPHAKDELAHYAKACTDIEYNFSFGWSELEGIANRTDFDLKQHAAGSGKDLQYFNNVTNERFYPYIIEPSGGVDRSVLAFMVDSYSEEQVKNDIRVVLKLHKDLAPVKIAVLPLLRNRPEIVELAKKIAHDLKKSFVTVYDDTGAIGKLYRRQDEVGTLYCVTVDVQTLEDREVTVRDRDTMLQERIGIDRLKEYLSEKLS
ncbi:MAG: glycine--tRNA ligase [Candidatus Omnitrophota bacterium]|nr:glycine--tRNA ligase [Candidatus Omnitrophota bacterium]